MDCELFGEKIIFPSGPVPRINNDQSLRAKFNSPLLRSSHSPFLFRCKILFLFVFAHSTFSSNNNCFLSNKKTERPSDEVLALEIKKCKREITKQLSLSLSILMFRFMISAFLCMCHRMTSPRNGKIQFEDPQK